MGATNCPETPRQKMIGMMYLFYTALLALNVSNEVIEAFIYVNESLQTTAINYREKSVQVYNEISVAYNQQPDKFEYQWKKAKEIHSASDSLYGFIEDIKLAVIRYSNGDDTTNSITYVKKQDDINAAKEIMTAEMGQKLGWQLEQEVIKYRELLLGVVSDTSGSGKFLKNSINAALATEPRKDKYDDSAKPWPETLTAGMPLVATYALLTKLQSDLRNIETDMYSYLIGDAERLDIKISELEALVAAPGAVMPGSRFYGRVFIGAKDTTMTPKIWVTYDGEPFYDSTKVNGKWEFSKNPNKKYHLLKLDDTGAGEIDTTFGASGSFGGLAVYESNLGEIIRPFKHKYSVGSSSGAITPTKMMVLYAGLDNPIQFAASGGADSRPVLRGPHIIRQVGNTAIVKPPASAVGSTITLTVDAVGEDGTTTRGDSQSFRVLAVPPPKIAFDVFGDGAELPLEWVINRKLEADAPDDFVFEGATYNVVSFTVRIAIPGAKPELIQVNGNSIASDPSAANRVRSIARSGTAVQFAMVNINSSSGLIPNRAGVTIIIQ
ncbi:MAG: GldM family protein [Bacteroidales bacterium]|nr:GldM family protein [Bacteroidales bacterium]